MEENKDPVNSVCFLIGVGRSETLASANQEQHTFITITSAVAAAARRALGRQHGRYAKSFKSEKKRCA